jgi:hypothetical protein
MKLNKTIVIFAIIGVFTYLYANANHDYLYIPTNNIYNGVHIRDDRDSLTGVYPTRLARPRPYRRWPYGQPNPASADAMGIFNGELRPGFGHDRENAVPRPNLGTINNFRPHVRFW